MKRILLTGATGFLGSHLLEALLRQGDRVTILKRSTSDTWRIEHLLDGVTTLDVDVQPLEDAFKNDTYDAVVHTACSYGRNKEALHTVVGTNVIFGLRILDAAIAARTPTFLSTDTFFNTGNSLPQYMNAYVLSKKQFSEWLKTYSPDIQIINLKLQHVYGEKDEKTKFIPWLIDQFKIAPSRIPLTEGNQLRDFIYISDVVSAYITALNSQEKMPIFSEFDVGTGKTIPLRDFVIELHRQYKKRRPSLRSELGFGDVAMRPGELMTVNVDISKLKDLGWSARENGPAQVIEHAIHND